MTASRVEREFRFIVGPGAPGLGLLGVSQARNCGRLSGGQLRRGTCPSHGCLADPSAVYTIWSGRICIYYLIIWQNCQFSNVIPADFQVACC